MRLVRIIERLLAAIPVVVGVLIIVFFFMRLLPGDPVEIILWDSAASKMEMDSLRSELNLDKPLYQPLWLFVSGVARGDFGNSLDKRQPVAALLRCLRLADGSPAPADLPLLGLAGLGQPRVLDASSLSWRVSSASRSRG